MPAERAGEHFERISVITCCQSDASHSLPDDARRRHRERWAWRFPDRGLAAGSRSCGATVAIDGRSVRRPAGSEKI